MRRPRAVLTTAILVAALVLPGAPGALAGPAPSVGASAAPGVVPPLPPPDADALAGLDPRPRPLPGVRARTDCVTSGAPAAPPPGGVVPWAQQALRFTDAWRFTKGRGQTVAVIDTGVSRHPRLAGRLVDGGDFVADSGGLLDCDGHGTLVAGIIAADDDPLAGFVGVAPEARILSIRQSSATVTAATPDGRTTTGGGDVRTLAAAVLHAVDAGATVVNISEAACVDAATAAANLAPLRAAVRRAVDADRVVVAAAGNAGSGTCRQSDDQVVAPAWFGDDVLSVGYTRRDGQPAPASLRGPWVSVSAPGSEIVSLDPAGPGIIDRITPAGARDPVGIEGTSFAAPYVSGIVALVRSRYPDLTARQVMERIRATASHPAGTGRIDDAVGAGTVDAVAALAEVRPDEFGSVSAAGRAGRGTPAAGRVDLRAARDDDGGARTVALVGSATAVLLLGAVGFAVAVARRGGPRRPHGRP